MGDAFLKPVVVGFIAWALGVCLGLAGPASGPRGDSNCPTIRAPASFQLGVVGRSAKGVPANAGIIPGGFVDLPTGDVTHGIDVSKYQDDADFASVYRCGGRFAYVRLSGGTDPDNELLYRTHWANARAARLVTGGYHNLSVLPNLADRLKDAPVEQLVSAVQVALPTARASARTQAGLAVSRLDELIKLDPRQDGAARRYLPLALDLTYRPFAYGSLPQKQAYGRLYGAMVCEFLDVVAQSQYGKAAPVLLVALEDYRDYGFAQASCNLARAVIWVRYRPNDGQSHRLTLDPQLTASVCEPPRNALPPPNVLADQKSRCLLEQYTSYGGFAAFGLGAPLDLDRFLGNTAHFERLTESW